MVLNVGQDGENNPYTETPGNYAQVDPKGTAFDLLFGQRWRVGGRWKAGGGRVHRLEMAMAKIIQTSRQPMTCCKVLQITMTIKETGSNIEG